MLLSELPHMEEKDAAMLNPLQLAYMGDVVWEMMVRFRLILLHKNVHHMHTECVNSVNAASQAKNLERIRPILSETEEHIVQRGRNAHARHPAPKNQSQADYSEATGFEALVGFLFLTGQSERLREIDRLLFGELPEWEPVHS